MTMARGQHAGSWNDERMELLRRLYTDGLSAGQIAKEMGLTRNAIIGKIYRRGLSGGVERPVRPGGWGGVLVKGVTSKPKPTGKRIRITPALGRVTEVEFYEIPAAPEDALIPTEQRRTLLGLTEMTCRWPCGHPAEKDFFFCGCEPVKGLPYCIGHSRVAFQPPKPRRPFMPGVISA